MPASMKQPRPMAASPPIQSAARCSARHATGMAGSRVIRDFTLSMGPWCRVVVLPRPIRPTPSRRSLNAVWIASWPRILPAHDVVLALLCQKFGFQPCVGIVNLLGGSRGLDELAREQGCCSLCGFCDAADAAPRLEGAGPLGAVVGCQRVARKRKRHRS